MWLVPAFVLAAALGWFAYPSGESPVSPRTRTLLRGLRAGGWLCVFLLALAPIVRWPEMLLGRFRVIVLTDRSLSMDLPASPLGGLRSARAGLAAAALRRGAGSRLDLVSRTFARSLADSSGREDAAFRGATAIGDALASSGGYAAGRPAAVVVISDGTLTQGEDPWVGAERLGLPVFTVLAADSTAPVDAALSEVAANATAYVGRPTPVKATVRSFGLAGRDAAVELREDGHTLARVPVRLARSGELELTLSVTPATPGTHFYQVALTPVAGELTTKNNVRLFALDVLADKSRVVMVQASPSFDFSALRRSLEEEADLASEFWTAGPGGVYLRVGASERVSAADLAARLSSATVIVLGDLQGAPGAAQLYAAAAARVRAGGGLWVFGGNPQSGLGSFRGSPLAPLLPFEVEQAPGASVALSPEPAAESRGDALFGDGGADASATRSWGDLPPAAGVRAFPVRPGARRILNSHTPGYSQALAATLRPPGGGRVFALNTGQLYRWTFTAQGAPGGNDIFPAFLSRVWRWLGEPSAGPAFSVRPVRRVVMLGETLEADLSGLHPGERATAEAVDAAGRATPMTVTGSEGAARAEAALPPGRYRIVARSMRGGSEVGRAQAEAAVEETGAEWIESAPDARGLQRTALAAGGKSFAASDTTALVRALEDEARRPRGTRESALHRQWWPYALILLIFGTEWWIRRRRGLP